MLLDQRGQATLEWVLLVAVIAIPGYLLIRLGLAVLAGHYQMGVTFTSLPGP